jgi:hypothetical protein
MKKIMMVHAVTMGLLLAGMFGLSMAAMELSKETKVGPEGSLVTQSGDAVLVGSSEMQIVSGPDGSQQLRSRTSDSSGGRRLDESASALVTVRTPDAVVFDLGIDDHGDRRLAQEHRYYELTHDKMVDLLKKMPSLQADFTPYLGTRTAAGKAMVPASEIVGNFVGELTLDALRKEWLAPWSLARESDRFAESCAVKGFIGTCSFFS